MKLLNQKAKVTSFLFFFDRNQPMTQPSAGKNENILTMLMSHDYDSMNL